MAVIKTGFQMHSTAEQARREALKSSMDTMGMIDKLSAGPEERTFSRQAKIELMKEQATGQRHTETLAETAKHNRATEAQAAAQTQAMKDYRSELTGLRRDNMDRLAEKDITAEESKSRKTFMSSLESIRKGIASKKPMPDEVLDGWANSAIQLKAHDPNLTTTTPLTDSGILGSGFFQESIDITPEEWVAIREAKTANSALTNSDIIKKMKQWRATNAGSK